MRRKRWCLAPRCQRRRVASNEDAQATHPRGGGLMHAVHNALAQLLADLLVGADNVRSAAARACPQAGTAVGR